MPGILDRLNRKFRTISEQYGDASWKDPHSEEYDRQWAEDALFHTIGPLTDTPQWLSRWTSESEPVPGFTPKGPAPRWTPEEVIYAMAGDPNLLFRGKDNPRSPQYGNRGGSPLFRMARKVARYYNRDKDRSFIADLYGNGFIPLVQMMQPGFDESRSPFISYVMRNLQSAMEHGTGGEVRASLAAGRESEKTGLRGMQSLLDETNPQKVREAANVVKGKYREQRSHDKHPDNPFGPFSSAYYQTAMDYADALETNNIDAIEAARNRMQQLIDDVDAYSTPVRGASTGLGQAISTPDRKTSIGIASMDAPTKGGDDEGSMAGNIPSDAGGESWIDPETVEYILSIALNYDLGSILAGSERYKAMAAELGAKRGIGGRMTVNELRYVIRTLGPLGSNYPGEGNPRTSTETPRDSRGWWQPGEDPEIEPLPDSNGFWHSIWSRNNYPAMGPQAIANEMTDEVREFNKLGIPTARKIKTKKKGNKTVEEVLTKVAVGNTVKTAVIKLKIIADIHRDQLGFGESVSHNGRTILEACDPIDASIIAETCDHMVRKINRVLVFEKSPEGWEGTVRAMKKYEDDIDNPYALAHWMKKKGAKPHYKSKKGQPEKKEEYKESKMRPVDTLCIEDE